MTSPDYRNTPFDLTDRTALITGASGGLGGRFAQTLASAGADLVLTARDAANPRLLALEEELAASVSVSLVAMDVGCPESVSRVFAQLTERGVVVDVLVNNAGIAQPSLSLIHI